MDLLKAFLRPSDNNISLDDFFLQNMHVVNCPIIFVHSCWNSDSPTRLYNVHVRRSGIFALFSAFRHWTVVVDSKGWLKNPTLWSNQYSGARNPPFLLHPTFYLVNVSRKKKNKSSQIKKNVWCDWRPTSKFLEKDRPVPRSQVTVAFGCRGV